MIEVQPTTLPALVVRAPWCFDIATGLKPTEQRSWSTPYRGPLAICAAKRRESGVHAGKAFCVVDLVDVRDTGCGEFDWVLARPRRIRPEPVAGRLGLFKVTIPLEYEVPVRRWGRGVVERDGD